MKKKIRFIINPKSGTKTKRDIPALVNRLIDRDKYDFEIVFTKAPKQGTLLSREAVDRKYDVVVSVGGDGSANEIAKGLEGSETAMAILPMGSGNGMARHLKIPMNLIKAMHVINAGKIEQIDTIRVNDEFCIGTIGVGFDAYVAHLFAKSSRRGFYTYIKIVLKEFSRFKPVKQQLTIDGKTIESDCFLLTVANSSQWGNDAVIAPFANVTDGIIDVSMMKKFSFYHVPALIWRLMHKSIHGSKFFSMMRGKNIVLKNNSELQGHIDGEPVLFNTDLSSTVGSEAWNSRDLKSRPH